MSTLLPRVLASLTLLAATPAALAQVATPPDATAPLPPADQPNGDSGGSADPCAGQPGTASDDQSLSGQLSNCGGVLTPPDTGANGIEVPAPDPEPNTTPVIPPGQVPPQAPNDQGTGSG